jgi:two-component system sensor histidine kinase PilS (NtrC family)
LQESAHFLIMQVFGSPGRTRPDAAVPRPLVVLQWVYVGRVLVALAVFLAAAFSFRALAPEVLLTLAIGALASLVMSGGSAFFTHILRRAPGATFIYAQAVFDLALVTTVVHVTGGPESDFIPLYILVIAVAAVLLPLQSGLLVTFLASAVLIADVVFGYPAQLGVALWLQIAVFVLVAVATGWVASRVRVIGGQREALERQVRRLQLEASDILRNIGSGVVTVDAGGNLVYANRAAEELLAFSATDYLGQPVLGMLDARSHELAAAIATTQKDALHRFRMEGRVTVNGRSFTIGLTTTLLQPGEDIPPSATAIFTDISDQKRLEELNLRAERLEAVAELSASLAHEIKNPLASIRSSVEQLSRRAGRSGDDRVLAGLVLRESDRLSRILNEFLEFARVRVAMSKPVDLLEVTRAAVEIVRQHPACTPETDIRVTGACPEIEGDEDLLHRVVVNLVLNAVQAANGAVRVVVEVREAEPGELPPALALDPAVLLRVVDDGPGIPHEVRDRLFNPFVTGRAGGSGLGLAIVQRAVQAHRGVVLVDTGQGRGTTFTILLPARARQERRG